jgi:general L-amino acid transport system substrate-binding protein
MRQFFAGIVASATLLIVSSSVQAGPVLERVRTNNTVKCGVGGSLAGFSLPDVQGKWHGIDVDYCRAVAAAVLGDPSRVTFVPVTLQTRFTALSSGEVDILARDTVITYSRDVNLGITFVGPSFYTGTGVMIRRSAGITSMEQLDGATICASQGGSNLPEVTDYLRARGKNFTPLTFDRFSTVLDTFFAGRCDAITAGAADLAGAAVVQVPNPQDYMVLPEVLSRDPYGPAVARGDAEWFSVARWTLYALIEAEERGITQANARELARTKTDPALKRLLGTEDDLGGMLGLRRDWIINVIEAVGNYGEIYNRHFGPNTPINLPRGQNNVVSRGGLHYGMPFR